MAARKIIKTAILVGLLVQVNLTAIIQDYFFSFAKVLLT